ncbi:N-acetylglutamate synthase-like GNAT family acetyltransferase [Clostridium saccharoperbutylacetonicum]|uniref:Acetyltransferase n=1 Tax=Clostridium saccharoperbutylacetonicum N1-4(HMT) TaxID=931276 RepID=M1MGW0_9CLOT|nr:MULTISPECIES: GNAT family N-acetyltransferase [Clostridium]AGF57159.1 acetyltransferase [Clostridium saccharoperbutylacetonicum N1-4(HMT)]NRT62082.1 N-acetylglutamate synthase-like GNAT family acetyltransferase [Clostridium saccharoperbutylacetonicum]NSB25412.1 N-acetylglutamate synthase-like GNAT family acetyltransferase [Clostridium saccharoperbutylacetonicum]NSB44781.1 N-acetylglutamate synthase-like GNAT family acetyltransferase [Clostridium saccharoperbutylacetonicum]
MKITETQANTQDAINLMEELSKSLEFITGDSGKNSFNSNDVSVPRSLFVVAYNEEGEAIGCGAIRPINEEVAEVKRMFAKTKAIGVGSEILHYLENGAKKLGYSALWLETRLINERAVRFYEKNGYHRISNYGKYVNKPEAVCFEKNIIMDLKGNY